MPIPIKSDLVRPKRVLLKDIVRDQIREAILTRVLRHGELLKDEELAAWLGASRNPIRAAIDELAREGLIETWPNRYTRVATPSESAIVSACHAMGTLYSGALRFAVPTLPAHEIERLGQNSSDLVSALRTRDAATVRAHFIPFFDELVTHCRNELYRERVQNNTAGLLFIAQAESVYRIIGENGYIEQEYAIARLRRALEDRDETSARAATEDAFLGWLSDTQTA